MPTTVAPSASALMTSVPERTPESNSTGVFPQASTTAGNMSMAAMPPLAWRPPWLEQ